MKSETQQFVHLLSHTTALESHGASHGGERQGMHPTLTSSGSGEIDLSQAMVLQSRRWSNKSLHHQRAAR
jgi:hypothetical protein